MRHVRAIIPHGNATPRRRARRAKGRASKAERRGKHQLIRMDGGDTLVVFRMNGDGEIGTKTDALDRFAGASDRPHDGNPHPL